MEVAAESIWQEDGEFNPRFALVAVALEAPEDQHPALLRLPLKDRGFADRALRMDDRGCERADVFGRERMSGHLQVLAFCSAQEIFGRTDCLYNYADKINISMKSIAELSSGP